MQEVVVLGMALAAAVQGGRGELGYEMEFREWKKDVFLFFFFLSLSKGIHKKSG